MPCLQERKLFDEKFIRLTTRRLCELTSAADALAMKPLVDLTSRALARLIEGKTPEQVRCRLPCPGKGQRLMFIARLPGMLDETGDGQAWPQRASTAKRPGPFHPGLLLVTAVAYTSRRVDNWLAFSHACGLALPLEESFVV